MARKTQKSAPNLLDLLSKMAPEGVVGPALRDRARPTLARDQFQLERLEIENLWSYRRAFLQFEPGITVIAGANGSGKSSLLESIFFALYGSEARHVIGRSLEEILRIGTETGSVKLRFLHSGQRYTAQIALRRQRANTKSERDGCQLICDDGPVWVGVENVIAEIERLFGMDREGFANCVYVRQGEIDRLIRADRKTREQMLDGLLGLYKLDLFVSPRSKEAQRALNRQADLTDERVARLRREIDALEREELGKQKLQLSQQIEALQAELETLDEHRTDAYKLLQSYDDSLKQFAQASRELQQTESELAEKQRRLAQRESERKEFEKELEDLSGQHQKTVLLVKTGLQRWELDLQGVLGSLEQATTFAEVAWVPTALAECQAQIESQRAKVQEAREQMARLAAERTQRERTVARLQEQYDELMRAAAREEEQIKDAEAELAALHAVQVSHEQALTESLRELTKEAHILGAQIPETLEGLDTRAVANLRASWARELTALEGQYEQAKRAVFETRAHCDALRRELTQKQKLLAEGRCPTCGQSVLLEHLAESLGSLERQLAELESLVQQEERELQGIEEKLALWKRVQTHLDQLVLESGRLEGRRSESMLKRTALEGAYERRQGLQTQMADLKKQMETEARTIAAQQAEHERLHPLVQELSRQINRLLDDQQKLEKIKGEIENLLRLREQWREKQAARKTLLESLNELRGDLARLHDRRVQLQERLQGQAEIESKRTQVQELLADLDKQRAAVQERYDQLAQARGVVQGRLEQLERLQQEMTQVLHEQEALEKLKSELAEIVSVYQTTKVELRKRNLEALNYYFNEFFSLMDSGDSYSRVTVRDDYEIEVELKNGRKLNPSLMSGGERALTNIALRCAIHQVLAKAVRRMPLILDEPTIYLDRDRVHRLQFLLEDLGRRVGQVIVVSHEVGLVEGADHEYRTEKGSDNISTLYKVR